MKVSNLNSNNLDRVLGIVEQNEIRGGYSSFTSGNSSSFMGTYNLNLEYGTISGNFNKDKDFNLNLVLEPLKIQITTSGDAKVSINGKEV